VKVALPGALAAVVAVTGAASAAQRLDDTPSPQSQFVSDLRWAAPASRASGDARDLYLQVAEVRAVEVRLDTTRYRGANARVYLALPVQVQGLAGSGGFRLSWQTRGLLYAGSAIPGARALLFDGVIQEDLLVEVFDFLLEVDAAAVTQALRFEPVFEIEPR
jgi:hypothetical protein